MRGPKQLVLALALIGAMILAASGVALAVTIEGNNNPNTITGTTEDDTLVGYDGADTISGLEGSDNIVGGQGADKLFGGDANQASRGGADSITGGPGNDIIVGANGADNLSGGDGADTILEGPANDRAADSITGGEGDDFINVAGSPSDAENNVTCGPGIDEVQKDPADNVADSCEHVSTVDIPVPTTGQTPDGQPVPAFRPTTEASMNTAPDAPDPEGAPADPPADGAITTLSHGYNKGYFDCWAPPVYRASRYCDYFDVTHNDVYIGYGLVNTTPRRWVALENWWLNDALQGAWQRRGTAILNEDFDTFDWVDYMYVVYVSERFWGYARASSYGDSSAYKWTWIDKGFWETYHSG